MTTTFESLLNLRKIFTINLKIKLFFLIFVLIFVAVIEMLVLALIPLYVALLINPKKDLEIININVSDLISNIYPDSIIVGFSIILICAFSFKLAIVVFSNYYELKLLKTIRLNFAKRLFSLAYLLALLAKASLSIPLYLLALPFRWIIFPSIITLKFS